LNQNNPRLSTAQLEPSRYGLDPSAQYEVDDLLFLQSHSGGRWSVEQIENYLTNIYSKSCSIEFDYLRDEEEKYWIAREFELMQQTKLDKSTSINILKLMLKSEVTTRTA
jgi:2-oxoglutarate dehydrogenase complex dehydrogenase (E1) component-like enzyme